MKKVISILAICAVVVLVVLSGGILYINNTLPDVEPAADITVDITPERIARGEYLANHVAICLDCHSERDWSKLAGPMKQGTEGAGGEKFDESMGMPGTIYSKNITPAALNTYSDGELLRTITMGVNKYGEALFPIMPYPEFNQLSTEDLYSIIAYIRTLKPINNKVPESKLNFPANLLVKTMPIKTYEPKESPDKNNPKEYGKYLVNMALCHHCHTQTDEGNPIPGMILAGGMEFEMPFGKLRSANITPDKETGIGTWTKEDFIKRFRTFISDSVKNKHVAPDEFNTIMPWPFYAGMTDEDLSAIYDYLSSVPPVKNRVTRFEKK